MTTTLTVLLGSVGGAAAAALIVRSILRARHDAALAGAQRESAEAISQARIDAATAQQLAKGLEIQHSALLAQLQAVSADLTECRRERDAARSEADRLRGPAGRVPELEGALREAAGRESALAAQVATLSTTVEKEQQAARERLALLADAQASMTQQFKNLANEILEDKSRRFTEQNQTNLGQLLDPLKNQLTEFKTQVERVYETEGKERSALAGQVRQLMDLNQTLGEKAENLTRALQGSSKAQGNWGELILERLLENAGLREGEEYVLQESFSREDGSRALPDVIVQLPNERSLVIDAKVSLNAYEEYTSSEDEALREPARKRHLESLRSHIRGLSERNYQSLHQLKSLDCVVMFIPIEPAFMLAVTSDRDLFQDAWNRNVLLVSPSTLMFVIRTVAHLWRQEAQNRNAQAIASRGAELYDKFAAFVADLEDVGRRLKQAEASYEEAHKKLATGRGNLVRQAELLRDLGVKPTKSLPANLLDRSAEAVDSPDSTSPP
ncbi:MAG: DNA recombination protein RmuC [Gammaproteobacteria bacterium]|nr:DNA recombination protein RmuC [Gammaproteobacteria bacterium]